ncbi:MAG: hypothetical protein Q8Q05_01075 [bacterium]|nr:hypothetical protein [bacterium]
MKNLKAIGWAIFAIAIWPITFFAFRRYRQREKARAGAYAALVRGGMCAKVEPEDIPNFGSYSQDFTEEQRAGPHS